MLESRPGQRVDVHADDFAAPRLCCRESFKRLSIPHGHALTTDRLNFKQYRLRTTGQDHLSPELVSTLPWASARTSVKRQPNRAEPSLSTAVSAGSSPPTTLGYPYAAKMAFPPITMGCFPCLVGRLGGRVSCTLCAGYRD